MFCFVVRDGVVRDGEQGGEGEGVSRGEDRAKMGLTGRESAAEGSLNCQQSISLFPAATERIEPMLPLSTVAGEIGNAWSLTKGCVLYER